MALKNDKAKKSSGIFGGGIPFGSIMDVVDAFGSMVVKYMAHRYEVEERVEKIKEDTRHKVEELRQEAIETGYALKKALFRTIVESIFLTTGLLALIIGVILALSDIVLLKWVLLGYGIVVTAFIIFQLKTAPKK